VGVIWKRLPSEAITFQALAPRKSEKSIPRTIHRELAVGAAFQQLRAVAVGAEQTIKMIWTMVIKDGSRTCKSRRLRGVGAARRDPEGSEGPLEGKKAAGPVSRKPPVALQTRKLFNRIERELSMMSASVVLVDFASHRRPTPCCGIVWSD
jgi:hypothetical protein